MRKKILISLASALLAAIFILTGCSQGIAVPVIIEPWKYVAPTVDSDGYNYEKTEYKVQINPDYNYSTIAGIDEYRLEGNGSYTSAIKWKSEFPTEYIIETEMVFNGRYKHKDGSYTSPDFSDTKTTKAVIASSSENFFPKSSEKVSKTSFIYQKTNDDKTTQTALGNIDYKETIAYDSDKDEAKATLYKYNPSSQKYDLPVPMSPHVPQSTKMKKTEYTFGGLKNKIIFDNSVLLYMIRSFDNFGTSTEFRQSFFLIDVEANELKTTQFASVKSETNNIFAPIAYNVNGQTVNRHAVYGQLGFSSGKTGQPLNIWYSNSKLANSNKPKYLLKMQQGAIEYYLEKVNGDYIQNESVEE